MHNETSKNEGTEINLLDYWPAIWKRRKMITLIVLLMTVSTAIFSFTMNNIYQAKAVIAPVSAREGGIMVGGLAASYAQQFGGLLGIPTAGFSSAPVNIDLFLKSNVLREKIIMQHNLLPVLFYKQWDEKRQRWKGNALEESFTLNPLAWVWNLIEPAAPSTGARKKEPGVPDSWDGLRALNRIVKISKEIKEGTVTITVDYRDPNMAAKIAEYFMISLTDHMSSEARRVSQTNMRYLEAQLAVTADPFIRQKIYNLIAQQIENSMMAEVKENFAFKVIDPPRVPDRKIKPNRPQMVIISFMAALIMGIFVAFLLEYLEKQNININNIGRTFRVFGKRR